MWYRAFFNLGICVSVNICHWPVEHSLSRVGNLMRSLFFFSNLSFRSNGPFPISEFVQECKLVKFD
jgi:hypothetical protein